MDADRSLDVVFFRTESGNEPVRSWLQGLSKEDKKTIGGDIKRFNMAGLSECLWCEKWNPVFGKSGADLISVSLESCLQSGQIR